MKFQVRIYDVGATGLVTLTGTCSPYVQFNFDQYVEIATPIVKDTIAPIWPFEHSFTYETTRDHALPHKYMTMRVMDTQGGQETFLGSCYISLETLACGPLQHDLPLWTSMGTTCGRIQLQCKMEQICDVKICMRDVKVVDLPMIEGQEPTTVLDVCYTNGPSIRSSPCLSTCSPSWDRMDLSFTGTLVSIWENSLRLSVCIQQSEGRAAIMGNAYLPFSKYHSNDAHEIIRFDEDVKIEPPFASSPTCHITGSLTMAHFPKYTPLIGGYHDEHGIHATRTYVDGIHVAPSHETLNGDVIHDDEYKYMADERRRQKQSKATIDALLGTTSTATSTATTTTTSTTKTDQLPSQPTLTSPESSYNNPFEDTPSTTSSTSAFEWMNTTSTTTQPSPFDLPNPSPSTQPSSTSPWDILDSTIMAPPGGATSVTPVSSSLDLLSFFAPPTSQTTSTQQPQQPQQPLQDVQPIQTQQQPQQQVQPSQQSQQQQVQSSLPPLPPHWEACIDPASGRTFYQNHLLKTTQWEYPTEGENEGKENGNAPVQSATVNITSAVTSHVTPSTVTPATVTPATVTPATVTPATVTPATVTPATITPTPTILTPTPTIPAATLPPHWEACIDPATGRTFYQNHLLKTTQWEWPSTGEEPGAAVVPAPVPATPVQPLVTVATPPVATPVATPVPAIPIQAYTIPQQPYITPTPIQSHHPAQLPTTITPTPIQSHHPAQLPATQVITPTPTPTPTPSLPLSQSIPKLPAGSAGYCIACTKPANYICHQTREPVCSRECKLSYLAILGITPTDPPQQSSLPPGAAGYCTVCKQPADYVCAQTKVPVCGKVCKEAHLKTVNKPAVTTPAVTPASKPAPASVPNDAEDRALAAAIAASLAMATPEQKTSVTPTPTTSTSTLPLGWTSSIDPASGRTFYIDTVLEKTQWEYPTPAQAHPHAKPQPAQITSRLAQTQSKPLTQPKPAPTPTVQPVTTPASGSWTCTACTYVNETPFAVKCDMCATQRVWTGAAAATTTPTVQPQPVRPAPIPVIPAVPLPPGWEACIDPNTGRTFYQNHITKTTQWQLPTAAATPATTPSYPSQPVYANGYPGVR